MEKVSQFKAVGSEVMDMEKKGVKKTVRLIEEARTRMFFNSSLMKRCRKMQFGKSSLIGTLLFILFIDVVGAPHI